MEFKGAFSVRLERHVSISENKYFKIYPENKRFSVIKACALMRGDTVSEIIQNKQFMVQ